MVRLLFVPSYKSSPTPFVVIGSGCVQGCPKWAWLGCSCASLACDATCSHLRCYPQGFGTLGVVWKVWRIGVSHRLRLCYM